MARNKRAPEDRVDDDVGNVHASRRKRVKYTEQDAQLAKTYNDLADEVQTVRIKAAGELLKSLLDGSERIDSAETRLIRGLCSGRKAARLGFSIALAEVFRLKFSRDVENEIDLVLTVDGIVKLTAAEGNISGQEQRDHLLGRRFAFQAVLQSDVGLSKGLTDTAWLSFIESIYELAAKKQWLRRDCGAMVYEYLTSVSGSQSSNSRVQAIVDVAQSSNLLKSPEGVGLWITVQENFPEVRLPKGVWHHRDPLSSKERLILSKVMLENAKDDEPSVKSSGARQTTLSFAWQVIFDKLYQRDDEKYFIKLWKSAVVSTMFSSSSSTERKALGLQLTSLALSTAPPRLLRAVLHANALRCILDQRAKPDRYLYDAAKLVLDKIIARAKQEPGVAGASVQALLDNGAVNFDQLTKTKTVESVIAQAEAHSLMSIASYTERLMRQGPESDEAKANNQRRFLADILLMMVRIHKHAGTELLGDDDREVLQDTYWVEEVLHILTNLAYGAVLHTRPAGFSDASEAVCRSRLMSCLNCLMDAPLEHAVKAPFLVVCQIFKDAAVTETPYRKTSHVLIKAMSCLNESFVHHAHEPGLKAFSLLLAMSILQGYNDEPDAIAALEDLVTCYQSRSQGGDATTMLIELLLSFVSKPSSLFRKLATQVFSAVAAEVTADGLHSLVDILGQKESLSGQQELFDQHDDEDEVNSAGGNEGDQVVNVEDVDDVEDASDVELINGRDASASEDEEDEDGGGASEDASDVEDGADEGDGEEAAFDKKLADALGTAGMNEDSDDDGSDMDDEQMMALEPHLTSIFKERQKTSSKKQDKQDAKENIVNFKNRVLDLLLIYVKSQYGNVLALDLILPLATLVRTTTNKPTAEKAFAVLRQYFDTCNKHRSLPRPDDQDACFEVLASVHEEMKLGGSKLHAAACSRSSLFLCKVLVALDQGHYNRIADMYAHLQSDWYLDPKSKVQASIFTEWSSWSIATRKHV